VRHKASTEFFRRPTAHVVVLEKFQNVRVGERLTPHDVPAPGRFDRLAVLPGLQGFDRSGKLLAKGVARNAPQHAALGLAQVILRNLARHRLERLALP